MNKDNLKSLPKENSELLDILNDLILGFGMYIDGYPFDEDHKKKQKKLLLRANLILNKYTGSINQLYNIAKESDNPDAPKHVLRAIGVNI